ncbi:hypothetical protein RSOLAG22IIIB_07095 [Rhizoctonia solani]|uniref:F-box domain-containing protein n=1 Tax=Rhizoctonia solani TaxID=456999 RepID=A0A0K6GJC2_9AGAM|nr:hypothetical protein RSOLAG22IIIB_07095 [Rhizoctonia solani]
MSNLQPSSIATLRKSLWVSISTSSRISSELCSVSQTAESSKNDVIYHLDSARAALTKHLGESSAMMARARNRLASRAYNLPEEVLSLIFMHVLFGDKRLHYAAADCSVQAFYGRLYALLEVCSLWRATGLSRPEFWSIIPVIKGPHYFINNKVASQSIHRSGELPMDLVVAVTRITPESSVVALAQHTSRFRTINISAEEPRIIQVVMNHLLHSGNRLDALFELSMCITNLRNVDRFDGQPYFMFSPNNPDHPLFLQTLKSLTRFRLTGATLDWAQVSFSAHLTELQVRSVILGPDSSLHHFLRAASTARQLQKLEFGSIISFLEPNLADPPTLSFPALQTLILKDLYFNSLAIILRSIVSRSHRLVFLPKVYWQTTSSANETNPEGTDYEEVGNLIKEVVIDTLLVRGCGGPHPIVMQPLLDAIPSLRLLKLDKWALDAVFCGLFTFTGRPFPKVPSIQNLYLTNAMLVNKAVENFKRFIQSHPLETIVIDGYINRGSEESKDWQPLTESDEIVCWLKEHVPVVHLIQGGGDSPPEFESSTWSLW